ncbi:hypothetical protein DDB_G0279841 [Dictyostelium discoideum AX4]|nr:hypothetical protein DDB_G0279841 [Dictyostelium discoideum AX4]EAL67534.1 hypothetical protein DDB_G0279841 [Dictyostelium discoideum AX4]|eukprot:XP_641514.1 hypothetical protein DDB_G0279841 [Dictyostelium discoideum AX4]
MNKLRYTPERIEQMSHSDKVEAARKMYSHKVYYILYIFYKIVEII